MAPETLEQTQRRLTRVNAPQIAAASAVSEEAPRLARRGTGGGTLRGILILAALLFVGVAAYVAYLALVQAGVVADKWTSYPGSAFVPSEEVLAGDSLETFQTRSDAALAELTDGLAQYGFEWSVQDDGSASHGMNGYGGESMLYDFMGPSLVGAAEVQDADARQRITDTFAEIMAEYPELEVYLANDESEAADSVSQFGSADRDEQAVWEIDGFEDDWVGMTISLDVFDASIPTESGFTDPYWLPPATTATLFVHLTTFAPHALSESDRDAFIAALEPYKGQVKPLWRG